MFVPSQLIVDYTQTVEVYVFHQNINYVSNIIKFLNLEGHQNCMIGLEVAAKHDKSV